MKRGKQFFVFVFCLLLLINILSAEQTIEVDYPDEVVSGQEFDFEIDLKGFEDGIYDAKIDVLSQSGQRIGRIYDDSKEKWQTTYYYVIEGIKDTKGEFKMKIEDYSGDAKIEIKIRKTTSSSSKTFGDYEIKVISDEKEDVSDEDEEEDTQEDENEEDESEDVSDESGEKSEDKEKESEDEVEELKESSKEITKISYNDINKVSEKLNLESTTDNEVIKLSQNIKSEEIQNIKEKDKKNYAFTGLIVFSLVLAGLFGAKYSKKFIKKEHGIV